MTAAPALPDDTLAHPVWGVQQRGAKWWVVDLAGNAPDDGPYDDAGAADRAMEMRR